MAYQGSYSTLIQTAEFKNRHLRFRPASLLVHESVVDKACQTISVITESNYGMAHVLAVTVTLTRHPSISLQRPRYANESDVLCKSSTVSMGCRKECLPHMSVSTRVIALENSQSKSDGKIGFSAENNTFVLKSVIKQRIKIKSLLMFALLRDLLRM